MRTAGIYIALILAFGLSAMGGARNGFAQQQDPLIVEADSTIERFERERDKLRVLTERLETLSGEDSLVTYRQMSDIVVTALDELYEMVDLLDRVEDADLDETRLRDYITATMERVPVALEFMAKDIAAQLVATEERRSHAAPEELGLLASDIASLNARLDELYVSAARFVNTLDRLNLDASEYRQKLETALDERATLVAGRLRLAMDERARYQQQLEQYPDDATYAQKRDAEQAAIDGHVASMEQTTTAMEMIELDATEYRTLLVEATGEISRGLGDAKVVVNLLQRGIERARSWVVGSGPGLLVKVLVFLAIIFAFRLISRVARKAVIRSIDSSRLQPSQLMRNMIANVTGNVVMLFGVLIGLSQMGISLGPLLAGLGVAGFILGFALQETLANFASGLMILFYRPFDVGDMVEAGGVFGKVSNMSLVSTTILTIDNQTLIVPNGKIWGDVIRNVTAQTLRRVDLVFGIAYSDDIPHAEAVLMSILKENDRVLDDPEPMVKLHELGDSSVNFVVRPWVNTDDYWDVYWDVTREVKMRFDREGISIPFPQRDVHIQSTTDEPSQ